MRLLVKKGAAAPEHGYDGIFETVQSAFDYIASINDAQHAARAADSANAASCTAPAFESVSVVLSPGVYSEILRYNLPNALTVSGTDGARNDECIIAAENCEAFAKDTENRALFTLGPNTTRVELRNFTLENTHVKTASDSSLCNQAEALCFHNYNGVLTAKNMRFISRQDTVHVKGISWFYNCYIAGDVDFLWGYCDTALFEKCEIFTRLDNRGAQRTGIVLQSRALAHKKGFVFLDCRFSADAERTGALYMARSSGTGSAESSERWDSIALIRCVISEKFADTLWQDIPGVNVFPSPADALTGWREYGTKTELRDGSVHPLDGKAKAARHPASVQLTDEEYARYYKDRAAILAGTPLASAAP
ncbi:MAG: pectinesterase family protein [Bacteroides sp.]|nr:pectinesterase family protein [Prevotella sp.]MCM1408620.1 pectinesterase family protein [Treponema brennaborense]MCM1468892.1 pectinesterase family protein [Bacteroides sp.]